MGTAHVPAAGGVLIIADDLTGANASAAGFSRAGLRAVTLRASTPAEEIRQYQRTYDAVIVTTDSRHQQPEEAARSVAAVLDAGWPAVLVCSRSDSTLRGNLGPEAHAILAGIRARGQRAIGLCMPAFPGAGRQTVDGLQLLHGTRLEDTELAHEVRSPVTTSSIAQVLQDGTALRTAGLSLSLVTGPQDALIARIRELVGGPEAPAGGAPAGGVPDVIIADALTDEHLARVARAAVAAAPDVMWVGIDPGPGSLAIAAAMGLHARSGVAPLLAVAGSATDLTQQQLAHLISHRRVRVVRPVIPEGSRLPDLARTAAEISAALASAGAGDATGAGAGAGAGAGEIVLLASVLRPADVLPLTPEESDELPRVLGRIVATVLADSQVGGLYTTGGDITASVLESIAGAGIEVEDEVVPLAAAGTVVGGPHSGLPIVTKGGLVGDVGTALECIDRLGRIAALHARASHRSMSAQ